MNSEESENSVFIKVEVGDDFEFEDESAEPMEIRQQHEVKDEIKEEIFDESSSSSDSDYNFPACDVEFENESCLKSEINSECGGGSSSSGGCSEINKRQDGPSMTLHEAIRKQLKQKVLDRMLKKQALNKEGRDKESTNEEKTEVLTCVNATPFIISSKSEKNVDTTTTATTTSKESKRATQMKKLRLPSGSKRIKYWKNGFPYRVQELLAKKTEAELISSSSPSTVTPYSSTFRGIINSNSAEDSSVNVVKKRKMPKRLPKVFKCLVEGCDRRFAKLQGMYGHAAMHRREDHPKLHKSIVRDSTICQVPSCKMTGIDDMEFHMRSHMKIKTGSFICPICDMNQKELDKLADHMMNSHGVTMPAVYSCPKCDQIFNTPGMRGIHMRKTHQA